MAEIKTDLDNCREMQPEILPGDTLIIEQKVQLEESKIFLVTVNNEQKFCRVLESAGGVWLIYSNAAYPPEYIPSDKMNTFRILGKVTKQIRDC